jgi:hypothetical protein
MRYLFVLGLMSLPVVASADPPTCGPSLEWLTCAADVAVVGQVKKIERIKVGNDVRDECTLEVKEVIRGKKIKPGQPLVFTFYAGQVDAYVAKALKSPAGILVFLIVSEGGQPALEGKLVPVPSQTYAVVGLSAPGQYAIDRQFRVLKDAKAVLDTCRNAAASWTEFVQKNPRAKPQQESVAVPPGTAAWPSLCRGDGCYLIVPKFSEK